MTKHAALVVLLAAAIASGAIKEEPAASGCFAVSYSEWGSGGEGRKFYEPLPAFVDLRDDVNDAADSSLVGFRSPVGPEGGNRITWRRTGSNSLAIRVPRGWSAGIVLRLKDSTADILSGALEDYADYGPRSTLRARVQLVRVPCKTASRAPAS